MKHHRAAAGFTLIELLLTIGMMSVLAGFSIPIALQWQQLNDVDIAAVTIAQSLRRAQLLAQAMSSDANWGVRVDDATDAIVLFQGEDFAGRDVDYDETFDLSQAITPSGAVEIVFDKLTGAPQATGAVVLTTASGQVHNIVINEIGTVSY